jgi:hypothetical protein
MDNTQVEVRFAVWPVISVGMKFITSSFNLNFEFGAAEYNDFERNEDLL